MNEKTDAVLIGGGLAGLTAALHLLRKGFRVTLIEKNSYPQHKVCGEYISAEVLPYLKSLGADVSSLAPAEISRMSVSDTSGKTATAELPLGGIGISRYRLDDFLFHKVLEGGGVCLEDTVQDIAFSGDSFEITTLKHGVVIGRMAIGAYGKRAALDQHLGRQFIRHKSAWLAVKAHYTGEFPEDLVALHNFKGGYCGVSTVEGGLLNICYLTDYRSFKKYKNIAVFQQEVMHQNPHLKAILEGSKMVFDSPLSISQISFEKKELILNHLLMVGDSAGLIHPLCGNGMAMAVHSAKICSELVIQYLNGQIKDRLTLEEQYKRQWNRAFRPRLAMGRFLSALLRQDLLRGIAFSGLRRFAFLLPLLIRKTHGKPLNIVP